MFKYALALTVILGMQLPLQAGIAPANKDPKPSLQIEDWMAAGSGCKGRKGKDEEVKMNVEQDSQNPQIYKFTFSMEKYRLQGQNPIHKDKPTFARECALRLALQPSVGSKIKNIRTVMPFVLNKGKGASAELSTRIIGSGAVLAQKEQKFDEKTLVQNKNISLDLDLDQAAKKTIAQSDCSAAKLIGVDMSLLTRRKSLKEKVEINLDKSEVLVFVELDTCR